MFIIFFYFFLSFNTRKVTDTKIPSTKIMEEDRNATEALRAVKASTFDGSDPDKVVAWIYELDGLFKAFHVPERLYKTLAVT